MEYDGKKKRRGPKQTAIGEIARRKTVFHRITQAFSFRAAADALLCTASSELQESSPAERRKALSAAISAGVPVRTIIPSRRTAIRSRDSQGGKDLLGDQEDGRLKPIE